MFSHKATMCDSKRAYTKRDAQTAVNTRSGKKRVHRGVDRNIRMYKCGYCDFYHLTSRPEPK